MSDQLLRDMAKQLDDIEALIAPLLDAPTIDLEEEASYETGHSDGFDEGQHALAKKIQELIGGRNG